MRPVLRATPHSVRRSAEEVQAQAVLALTPGRKLELAAQLRELAWELKALGIRSQHPGMPDANERRGERSALQGT